MPLCCPSCNDPIRPHEPVALLTGELPSGVHVASIWHAGCALLSIVQVVMTEHVEPDLPQRPVL